MIDTRSDPGDCPADLLIADFRAVYRPNADRHQCRWIDCDVTPRSGTFCDQHRRWHAQRLAWQIHQIAEAATSTAPEVPDA